MRSDAYRPLDSILVPDPTFDSTLDVAVTPSKQPLPAEHPSAPATPRSQAHTPSQSKDNVSPKTIVNEKRPSDPTEDKDTRRSKGVSISIPVLPNNGYNHPRAASVAPTQQNTQPPVSNARPPNALKISIPTAADVGFLTALASQERQVLELKEQLHKAEGELSRLKRQWVSQESKKRQSEARGLHRMTSTSTPTSAKLTSSSIGAGPPSIASMYEEMHRRKASWNDSGNIQGASSNGDRQPRRRFFSGSRQLRSLSLVTPPITEYSEESDSERKERPRPDSDSLEGLVTSPGQLPPTPDLIEEEEDTDPSTSSARSSSSPHRERMLRSSMRTSMQMAAEFREGLWTFFEDLKQATVGEEARGSEAQGPRFSDKEVVVSPSFQRKDSLPPTPGSARSKKQTVRRQTWQFRPQDTPSDTPLIDSTTFWKEQGIAEADEAEKSTQQVTKQRSQNALNGTPRPSLREQEHEGEVWQTWDSPKRGVSPAPPRSKPTTAAPQSGMIEGRKPSQISHELSRNRRSGQTEAKTGYRKSSAAVQDANSDRVSGPPSSNKEHFRRDSMAWPVIDKIKSGPGQLRQGVNSLLDDWERSLSPPAQTKATGLRTVDKGRSSSPVNTKPVTQRSNSRLDMAYQ